MKATRISLSRVLVVSPFSFKISVLIFDMRARHNLGLVGYNNNREKQNFGQTRSANF